ncbi:hypothetical protein AJ87_40570 [Rhizobium yanglingense]|nr:hypothetical protein AJ87_40570 [Rhizobium yanglingense]
MLGKRCERLVGDAAAVGDEIGRRIGAVFRLNQKVECGKSTMDRIVGKDHHLGRAGRKAGIDDAGERALGSDNPRAAGADDLQRRLDGFGSVGNRRYGLGTADLVDCLDAGKSCCNEGCAIDGAVRRRWCDDGEVRDACNRGRNRVIIVTDGKEPLPRGT